MKLWETPFGIMQTSFILALYSLLFVIFFLAYYSLRLFNHKTKLEIPQQATTIQALTARTSHHSTENGLYMSIILSLVPNHNTRDTIHSENTYILCELNYLFCVTFYCQWCSGNIEHLAFTNSDHLLFLLLNSVRQPPKCFGLNHLLGGGKMIEATILSCQNLIWSSSNIEGTIVPYVTQ